MVKSKISHSMVVSETLYSKGFTINPKRIEEYGSYINKTKICDNPGYNDTRGSDFRICTKMSMDRAIDVCASISAIVLIIPWDWFCNRNPRMYQLIQEML